MNRFLSLLILLLVAAALCAGCKMEPPVKRGDWHRRYSWQPERYFRDQPLVVELCYAIEAEDLAAIDRLVAAGADVNARGVANMTPLMWAYPDDKIDRFRRLLELGADPNVIVKSDLNTRGAIKQGEAVTHLAVLHPDIEYFKAVFNHGGDPTLVTESSRGLNTLPLFQLVKWGGADKELRIQYLISKGVNLNTKDPSGVTATMTAVGWGGQYNLALLLLKSGADLSVYQDNGLQSLAHIVLREQASLRPRTPQQNTELAILAAWMKSHGANFAGAQADLDRWRNTIDFDVEKERKRQSLEEARRRAEQE